MHYMKNNPTDSNREMRTRLLGVTALAAEYCVTVENAAEAEPDEFVAHMLHLLPRIYMEFNDIVPGRDLRKPGSHDHDCGCGDDCHCHHHHDDDDDEHECGCGDDCECGHGHHHHPHDEDEWDEYGTVSLEEDDDDPDDGYYGSYIDEDYYNSVRRHMGQLLGPDDVFLETFEEDMKYSDTPIAASVSECLADIFQPLYNFISIVKDTDGEQLEGAYRHAHEEFAAYWSQTLCNVLRALNHIYYNTLK